jgi:hypothetical protein
LSVETAADNLGCASKLRACDAEVVIADLEMCSVGGDGVVAHLYAKGTASNLDSVKGS